MILFYIDLSSIRKLIAKTFITNFNFFSFKKKLNASSSEKY